LLELGGGAQVDLAFESDHDHAVALDDVDVYVRELVHGRASSRRGPTTRVSGRSAPGDEALRCQING